MASAALQVVIDQLRANPIDPQACSEMLCAAFPAVAALEGPTATPVDAGGIPAEGWWRIMPQQTNIFALFYTCVTSVRCYGSEKNASDIAEALGVLRAAVSQWTPGHANVVPRILASQLSSRRPYATHTRTTGCNCRVTLLAAKIALPDAVTPGSSYYTDIGQLVGVPLDSDTGTPDKRAREQLSRWYVPASCDTAFCSRFLGA